MDFIKGFLFIASLISFLMSMVFTVADYLSGNFDLTSLLWYQIPFVIGMVFIALVIIVIIIVLIVDICTNIGREL